MFVSLREAIEGIREEVGVIAPVAMGPPLRARSPEGRTETTMIDTHMTGCVIGDSSESHVSLVSHR